MISEMKRITLKITKTRPKVNHSMSCQGKESFKQTV